MEPTIAVWRAIWPTDVAFVDNMTITVIEEDWPDGDDRGSRAIPALPSRRRQRRPADGRA